MDEEIRTEEKLVDKLVQVEVILEEYEKKIHLDKVSIIEPNFSVDKQLLESMSIEDLQTLAWEYGCYALAIQKEVNRHQSRYNWAEANLKRILERDSPDYPGFKWEERQSGVLNNNSYAQKLNYLKIQSKLAIDRLSFIPSKIQFLSELARDIMKTKRYRGKDE